MIPVPRGLLENDSGLGTQRGNREADGSRHVGDPPDQVGPIDRRALGGTPDGVPQDRKRQRPRPGRTTWPCYLQVQGLSLLQLGVCKADYLCTIVRSSLHLFDIFLRISAPARLICAKRWSRRFSFVVLFRRVILAFLEIRLPMVQPTPRFGADDD